MRNDNARSSKLSALRRRLGRISGGDSRDLLDADNLIAAGKEIERDRRNGGGRSYNSDRVFNAGRDYRNAQNDTGQRGDPLGRGSRNAGHPEFGKGLGVLTDKGRIAQAMRKQSMLYGNSPGRPAPEVQGSSMLEDILARLNGAGGPQLIPEPDRGLYMRPFDEATTRANESYSRALPQLKAIYDDLDKKAGAGQKALRSNVAALTSEREQQMANRAAELRSDVGPSQAALVQGGEAATGADDQAVFQQRLLKENFDAERARTNRLAKADEATAVQLDQQVDESRANSSAAARNNLDDILGQIGVGRSEAEMKYEQDRRAVAAQNEQIKQAWEQERYAAAQQALDEWVQMNTGLAEAATSSRRQQFEARAPELASSYPRQWAAFQDIIGEASGKGQMGFTSALREMEAMFSRGDEVAKQYGAKFGKGRIRQWLEDYYDDEERIDKNVYQSYGGDPAALGFFQGGISNPQLMRLLLGGGR
jgi:hypothetical protein